MTLQKSIQTTVSISGIGLHTGKPVTLTFHPALADSGIVFRRIDLPSQPVIPALAEYVTDTARGTTLTVEGVHLHTIEHVLAALTGLGIDNVRIDCDAAEMPIMDGSARPFVAVLQAAGIQALAQEKKYIEIQEKWEYIEEARGVHIQVLPSDTYEVEVWVDYNSPVLPAQSASIAHIDEFVEKIASCRTFCFLREVEMMYKAGLIKGGSLENAIVIADKAISEEELSWIASVFPGQKPEIQEGILNNLKLQFDNEPARHKLLDVIGDLTLVGKAIKGKVIAKRPGHKANTEFAKLIRKHYLA